MTKYATKKNAMEIINREKELHETAYLDGELTMKQMKEMLIWDMRFGKAEANFILAAMVNAGAKFKVEE